MSYMEYGKKQKEVREYRTNAFTLLGVAHFNYNSVIRGRQVLERLLLERQEKRMEKVEELLQEINKMSNDSVMIANFTEQLVKNNPKLASSLEFMLGVDLQEKARREEDASKV